MVCSCMPDTREFSFDTYRNLKEKGIDLEKELRIGTNDWFKNNLNLKGYQLDFLNLVAVPSIAQDLGHKLPAEVMIAQAILESGWGKSNLSKKSNNYFGIKEYRRGFKKGVYETEEYVKGKTIKVNASFRVYETPAHCFADRAEWFITNKRYRKILKKELDCDDFIKVLKKKGYATDPNYDKNLKRIVKKYKLKAYVKWAKNHINDY